MTHRRTSSTVPPPPRWAVWCAWAVPALILPSAVWRVSVVAGDPAGFAAAVAAGGWYLVLLSVLSMTLGLLTVGLVRPWGVVLPRRLGGWEVPARFAARVGIGGGVALILLTTWFFVFVTVRPFAMPVLIDTGGPAHPRPGRDVLGWYAPLVAWGPLVIAVAVDHGRRRIRGAAGAPRPAHARRGAA